MPESPDREEPMLDRIRFWMGTDEPLGREWKDFFEMLAMGRDLYGDAWAVLHGEADREAAKDGIYRGDVAINKSERQLRKQLVTHLAVNPEQDAVGCLLLMSLVKDAERIGDCCKNIYEAACILGKSGEELRYWERLEDFGRRVDETFEQTIRAMKDESPDIAEEVVREEVDMNREFDSFIEDLANSDLRARQSVGTVLLVRAVKRVRAHLSNVASSIVMPLPQLDHRPRDLRPKWEKKAT